jgi:hypothetical protein
MSEHRVGARDRARVLVLKAYLSSGVAVGALAAALAWPGSSQAACILSGTTLTCSGVVTGAPNGFGDGTQNNLTIIVNPTSVSGTQAGFNVGSGNTFTIANGATVQETNASPNGIAAILTAGGVSVGNSGSISAPGALGINALSGDVTVTSNTGTISALGAAIQAQSGNVTVTNSATITGGGLGAIVSDLGSGNIMNMSGGTITGNVAGSTAIATATGLQLTNGGMIQQTGGNGNIAILNTGGLGTS